MPQRDAELLEMEPRCVHCRYWKLAALLTISYAFQNGFNVNNSLLTAAREREGIVGIASRDQEKG